MNGSAGSPEQEKESAPAAEPALKDAVGPDDAAPVATMAQPAPAAPEAAPAATPAATEKSAEDKAQEEHDKQSKQAEQEREEKKFSEHEQKQEDQITAMVLSTVHTHDPIELAEKMDADDQPEEMTKEEQDEYELAIKEAQTDSEIDKSLNSSMAQEEKYGNLVQKSAIKTKTPKLDKKPVSNSLIMLTDEVVPKEMDANEQKEYKNAVTLAATDAQKSKSLSGSMVQEEKYGNLVQKVRGPPGHAKLLQISSDKKDDLSDAMKEMAKEDAKEHDKPKKDQELSKKPSKMDQKEQKEYDTAVEKSKKDIAGNVDPKAKTLI